MSLVTMTVKFVKKFVNLKLVKFECSVYGSVSKDCNLLNFSGE